MANLELDKINVTLNKGEIDRIYFSLRNMELDLERKQLKLELKIYKEERKATEEEISKIRNIKDSLVELAALVDRFNTLRTI
jgi:H2-forming N5,N10-methylenetetrahydromethanopterin dehydrogenase-like enzyme